MARKPLGYLGQGGPRVLLDPLSGVGPVYRFKVTGNLSGQTQFADKDFVDFPNDAFNDAYVAVVDSAENITAGTVVRVTDFARGATTTKGTFTVDAAGANWAVGDEGRLVPAVLLGLQPDAGIYIHKGATINPTTAGVDLTGVASGDVWIEEISVQKITALEGNNVTELSLVSNDTVPLDQQLRHEDGAAIKAADLQVGDRYTCRVNWKLASGKKLQVKTAGANGTAGYLWTVKGKAITAGASLASA